LIAMQLNEAARALNAEMLGSPDTAATGFRGVSTDTRTLNAGELYVALKGPRFDGHTMLETAAARGASAVMVEHEVPAPLPALKVDNTRKALGRLAGYWRSRFGLPLVAVTGSNGKTTVKEMLAAILRIEGEVLFTTGNLNNDIGVPLTLFRLDQGHRYAVVEMGANHPGEIAWLCDIAAPTIAAITVCAPAHLEGFGSVEGVARAKGEIVSGLRPDGVAVLNAEDRYLPLWRELSAGRRVLSFGIDKPADVTAANITADGFCTRFDLGLPEGAVTVDLPLPGRHNVMNALAAAAAAHAAGIAAQNIRAGLEAVRPVHGRLERLAGLNGCTVIDDTYNANPASLQAGLAVLRGLPGAHWLVLGDMGELGAEARQLHREAGAAARDSGVARLYGVGPLTVAAVEAFGGGARHYADVDALTAALRTDLDDEVSLLVKGSRAMQMDRVVAALRAGEG
jgi:UDP-N-acetylmuramoyl-tripeptide--D-alanyl-D-alanine ligase